MATAVPERSRPTVPVEDRAVHLYGLLRGVNRWQMFQIGTRITLLLAAIVLAAALGAILLDAVLALPAGLRLTIDVAVVLALLVGGGALIRELLRQRFDPRRAARQVECRLNVPNSLLINAVEFANSPAANDSPALRDRVVRMAEERARDLSAADVLPLRPVWRALGLAAAAAGLLGLAWLTAPRMFAMVLPRYLDPSGDHPPFTLTTFDVAITPEPVYHGRPATITALLGGPEQVERADVAFLAEPAQGELAALPEQRTPMFRTDEQKFVLELEAADQSRRFYIDTPSGRSPTLRFDVVEVPFFEGVTVRYEYPAYTGWPPQEQSLDARGMRALAGTEAIITARSNLPLASGRLSVSMAGQRGQVENLPHGSAAAAPGAFSDYGLTPLAGDPRAVQGRIRLDQSGHYSLSLSATSGGESLEPLAGPITVVADKPPRVAIVEPQPHVIVVENWDVPVIIEAADDVGVAGLRLSRSVNGWGPATIDLAFEPSRAGAVRAEAGFDLAALGARAGDVIEYYATAADNHANPAQFTDSATHVIQVISEKDYVQFARQQYQMDDLAAEFEAIQEQLDALQQQREAALKQLEEVQKQLEQNPGDPELQQQLKDAEEQLQKLAQQSEALAKKLEERAKQMQLYEVEQPYTEGLKQLAEQMRQQSQAAQATAEALQQLQKNGATPENQKQLADAADKLRQQQAGLDDESRQQREATQQDLELYQMADRMLSQSERLKSIIQQQRELATRLGEFQNQSSLSPQEQQRADQLAKQQEGLEQELQEVAKELEAAAEAAEERLPKMSESARKIAEAIREQQIPEDQQQAASQARQGSGRAAHERADSAAHKLEALAGQCPNCQGAAGEMAGELDGPLSLSMDSLQRSLEQMSQGRSLPGLPRPGSGKGNGQSRGEGGSGMAGQSGQPQGGEGSNSRWRPGQTFPGSQSRTPILGPRMMVEEQQRPQPGGRLGGNERGTFVSGSSGGERGDAESLTPEAREFGATSAGSLRGVPVPYRKDAEAYFRRLAEDEAAK
jgi:hypothetical protein